ncbi:tyrosine-protein phosphatase [Rhodocyclaceae bacterium SMB388]
MSVDITPIMDLSTRRGRVRAWLNMHIADHGLFRLAYANLHALGGDMYRSSQPSPSQIRDYHERHGIRSIINLRGCHPYGSYALEKATCEELGIELYDFPLYSRIPPAAERVDALRKLFDRIEYPALMHCKSGADRVGLAAALYRIFRLAHPVEEAARELALKYGHFSRARTGVLGFFLACYVADRAKEPMSFIDWNNARYDEKAVKSRFRESGWASLIVDDMLHRE